MCLIDDRIPHFSYPEPSFPQHFIPHIPSPITPIHIILVSYFTHYGFIQAHLKPSILGGPPPQPPLPPPLPSALEYQMWGLNRYPQLTRCQKTALELFKWSRGSRQLSDVWVRPTCGTCDQGLLLGLGRPTFIVVGSCGRRIPTRYCAYCFRYPGNMWSQYLKRSFLFLSFHVL